MRTLLIAALFHDFDHTGRQGNDDINIELAKRGLEKHVLQRDKCHLHAMNFHIEATQFPHVIPNDMLDLSGRIIRDADLAQAFDRAWIQQVIFGLAAEWDVSPMKVLEMQTPFCEGLEFLTEWAQSKFTQECIKRKTAEARSLLELLNTK